MKLRRILVFLIVLTLCLGVAAPGLAASADDSFLKSLKGLESYLRTNYSYNSNMGSTAENYLLKNYPTMDVERLNACLARFLGCSERVQLSTKLNDYARNLRSGYKSIYELAVLYKISPEMAAERTYMDRAQTAMEIAKQTSKPGTPSKPCTPPCYNPCNPCNPCTPCNPCNPCNPCTTCR